MRQTEPWQLPHQLPTVSLVFQLPGCWQFVSHLWLPPSGCNLISAPRPGAAQQSRFRWPCPRQSGCHNYHLWNHFFRTNKEGQKISEESSLGCMHVARLHKHEMEALRWAHKHQCSAVLMLMITMTSRAARYWKKWHCNIFSSCNIYCDIKIYRLRWLILI